MTIATSGWPPPWRHSTKSNARRIRLRYVEQMPSKEIAERLSKTDGAVRVMLTRALKTLQTVLMDAGLSGHW